MDRTKTLLSLLACLVMSAGCYSHPTFNGSARAVPLDGDSAFGAGFSTYYLPERKTVEMFTVQGSWRQALSEHAELGLRFWNTNAGVQIKYMFLRSQDRSSGLDLSIAPLLGGGYNFVDGGDFIGGGLAGMFSLPLLVGINTGGGTIDLGARLSATRYLGDWGPDVPLRLIPSGSVGYSYFGEIGSISPQISFIWGDTSQFNDDRLFGQGLMVQLGVAVQIF